MGNTIAALRYSPVLLTLLLAAAPAQAAECVPSLRILNSVQMQSTTDRTTMLVPVKIDGSDKKLLLDTGGLVSQISRATADALNLPQRYSPRRLFDLAGNASNAQATLDRLTLGERNEKGISMLVAPNPELGTSLPYDGLLATDLLSDTDIDMDFGARRLTAFSTDHCDGQVIYWPADHVAAVPITVKRNLIFLPVTVDGHVLNAVLDTGSQYTAMNLTVANQLFGLTPESPDMRPLTLANGEKSLDAYGHRFETLTFDGVKVLNLQIYLMQDKIATREKIRRMEGLEESDDVVFPDLLIGMDVLRHLHVYYATKEKRLYISEAARGESALFRYQNR
jgi:predicted aspartyl protease